MSSIFWKIRTVVVRTAVYSNMMGTCMLFLMVVLMNSDVVARGIFNSPIKGVVELVIFSLVLIVFLQLPDVVNSNRLTRSDGFLGLIKTKKPNLAMVVSRVIDGAAGVFMALIAWTIWPEFVDSIGTCGFWTQPEFGPEPTGDFFKDFSDALARCDYFGTPGIFTAPWWPVKLAVSFSVTMSAIIFFFKALLGEPKTSA